VAEVLVVRDAGGWLGIALLAGAAPVAIAAWLALGAPKTRADLGD